MKLIPVTDMSQLTDGCKVRCKIDGVQVDYAALSLDHGLWYVCQSVKEGGVCADTKGYSFSWIIGGSVEDVRLLNVTDLCLVVDDAPGAPDAPDVIVAETVKTEGTTDAYVLMLRYGAANWCSSGAYGTAARALAAKETVHGVTAWRIAKVSGLPIEVAGGEVNVKGGTD